MWPLPLSMDCRKPLDVYKRQDFARVLLDLIPEKLSDSFLDGYYGKSCHIKKDIRIIRLFLLMKIVEICSWSYKRSPDYYVKTFHTLENMYDQSDE